MKVPFAPSPPLRQPSRFMPSATASSVTACFAVTSPVLGISLARGTPLAALYQPSESLGARASHFVPASSFGLRAQLAWPAAACAVSRTSVTVWKCYAHGSAPVSSSPVDSGGGWAVVSRRSVANEISSLQTPECGPIVSAKVFVMNPTIPFVLSPVVGTIFLHLHTSHTAGHCGRPSRTSSLCAQHSRFSPSRHPPARPYSSAKQLPPSSAQDTLHVVSTELSQRSVLVCLQLVCRQIHNAVSPQLHFVHSSTRGPARTCSLTELGASSSKCRSLGTQRLLTFLSCRPLELQQLCFWIWSG